MSRRERNLQEQEFSKKEMKVFGIIGLVCALLMVLVIVITVINGTDNRKIADEYELTTDNVYEFITLDEIESKQRNEESFHIIVVSSATNKTKTFMKIADTHAKDFGIKDIYLLEVNSLSKEDRTRLTAILEQRYDDVFGSNPSMSLPSLVYFDSGYPIENSGLTKHDNQTSQIKEYFSNCGYTYED